ncbi:hypothetical protein M885DRAFT_610938, partial [Pelagophyceae sp. CCMP2097]
MMLHAMRRARPLCQGLRVGNAVAVQHRSMSMTSMFSGLMSGLGGLTGMKMPEGVKPEEAQRMAAKMMQNPELVQMMQDPKFQVCFVFLPSEGGLRDACRGRAGRGREVTKRAPKISVERGHRVYLAGGTLGVTDRTQVIMKDVMASGGNSVALMKHMA